MRIFSYIFFIFLFAGSALQAQTDSLDLVELDYFYVHAHLQEMDSSSHPPSSYRCMQIDRRVHRLDLHFPANRFLATQQGPQGQAVGLLPYIMEMMRKGQLTARDAKDNRSSYAYSDLLQDMYMLEDLEQELYSSDTLRADLIDWSHLSHYLDFITEECFDKLSSRRVRKILAVRVNYYNPQKPGLIFGVMMLPMDKIVPLLESMKLRNGWTAMNMVHSLRYASLPFSPDLDRRKTLRKPKRW